MPIECIKPPDHDKYFEVQVDLKRINFYEETVVVGPSKMKCLEPLKSFIEHTDKREWE